MYIHVHYIRTFSRFIKGQFAFPETSTALIRIAIGSCLYKKNRRTRRERIFTDVLQTRYRRSVKAPIADYHVPVAAQESHQFFFLSHNLACVNGCAFHIVATCETLGFYALSRQISRAEIDIWSRTSSSPCAQYTHVQFVDIKSEDDLTLSDMCYMCMRKREKNFIFKELLN